MIEAPETPVRPSQLDFDRTDEILSENLGTLVRANTQGWATTGARIGCWTWDEGSPWSTTNTSWTVSDDNGGLELSQTSPIVCPQRSEIGALQASVGQEIGPWILEIQVFGSDVDLEVSLYRRGESPDMVIQGPAAHVKIAECTGGPQWQSVYMVVERSATFGYQEFMLSFQGRAHAAATGEIWQIAANEMRWVEYAHERREKLWAYGSEWVGMYQHADTFGSGDQWDADGALYTLEEYEGTPQVRRDEVAAEVCNLRFMGDACVASPAFDIPAPTGLIGACAFLRDSATDGTLMRKATNDDTLFVLRVSGSELECVISSTGGADHAVSTPAPPGGWHDVVWWWDDSKEQIALWLDGERVDWNAFIDPVLTGAGRLFVGAYDDGVDNLDGDIALPMLLGGSFSRHQVEHLMQWRRSIHGLY